RSVEALLKFEAPAEKFLQSSAIADLARQVAGELVALIPGQRIGHYEIKERIGAGGMGEVWRGGGKKIHRGGGVKGLPPGFLADPDPGKRVWRGARRTSKSKHLNIITIYSG